MTTSRRQFVKTSALGACAAGTTPLAWMSQARAATPTFNDYKASVCIFLSGGNDALNMLIPIGSDTASGYPEYSARRAHLAVANNDLGLNSLTTTGGSLNHGILGRGAANPYYSAGQTPAAYLKGVYSLQDKGIELGVNGLMPELAQLISNNTASVISNVGTLVEPVTRNQIQNHNPRLPQFLFAHNHQQNALKTDNAAHALSTGWVGRLADSWNEVNNRSALGMNVSYAGNDKMMTGAQSQPLTLGTNGPGSYSGMSATGGAGQQDKRAAFRALAGEEGDTDRLSFDPDHVFNGTNPFARFLNRRSGVALDTVDLLNSAWRDNALEYSARNAYGDRLFSVPDAATLGLSSGVSGRLIRQLEAVAKMIWLGATDRLGGGVNRQMFYVNIGGFDTHANQDNNHPMLLREISLALWDFQQAMNELNLSKQVTSFTMSDFGRSVSINGDGTDHAWGSSQLVMGGDGSGEAGSLAGGQQHGELPDLRLDGADDISRKGRIIPTLAQEQVNASICDWFGVPASEMPALFPNLSNFQTNSQLQSAYVPLFV